MENVVWEDLWNDGSICFVKPATGLDKPNTESGGGGDDDDNDDDKRMQDAVSNSDCPHNRWFLKFKSCYRCM
jgi:hypothetical protein